MENSMINKVGNTVKESVFQNNSNANVEMSERVLSVGAGAFLSLNAIGRLFSNPLLGIIEMGVAAMLLDRGISGYCSIKAMAENRQMDSFSDTSAVPVTETTVDPAVIVAVEMGSGSSRT